MSQRPDTAMILAAGLGTRMRPITDTIPKPLVPVAGRTLVDHTIDRFEEAGVPRIVVNAAYKRPLLEAHLAQRSTRAQLVISPEAEPLETGGGIVNALPLLGTAPFYVANSDIIWRDGPAASALTRLAQAWDDARMDALLLVHPVAQAVGYHGRGDFLVGADGTLRRPANGEAAPYVFAGVHILHPRIFAGITRKAFPLGELFRNAETPEAAIPRIYGLVHDGLWLHVGDPQSIVLAEAALAGV